MQKMAENATQQCHRLAATQLARPILAYPPSPSNLLEPRNIWQGTLVPQELLFQNRRCKMILKEPWARAA